MTCVTAFIAAQSPLVVVVGKHFTDVVFCERGFPRVLLSVGMSLYRTASVAIPPFPVISTTPSKLTLLIVDA